jgi:hypothetical protein
VAVRYQVNPEQDFSPTAEQCRELVKRIQASSEFQRATRLREFLSYILERKLASCPEEITETLIGHRVYGRPAAYNSGDDSIVRTEARTLRQRLERYFSGEGAHEPIVLEIPRGGYVPVFHARTQSAPLPASLPLLPENRAQTGFTRRQWIWFGAAATGAGAILVSRSLPLGRSTDGAHGLLVAQSPGLVQLESSDSQLTLAFQRAKQRALSCVYSGDPVGDWYAIRPDGKSNVFCMRDVSHQSVGAAVLGLNGHTANMLRRFAQSVAKSRDWCGYWIITKDGFPAPQTYNSDADFGYCLPASFDVMRACYRQFLWTGDPSYQDSVFSNFYERTVINYVETWDQDRDGIMENLRRPRVKPTYLQGGDLRLLRGADLVAAQYAGYLTYAAMQESKGNSGSLSQRLAQDYRNKANALRGRYNAEWWNAAQNRFYSGVLPNGSFAPDHVPECNLYSLSFGIPEDGLKTEAALDDLQSNLPKFPGAYSYIPEVLYHYGRNDRAYSFLQEIADPNFFGNDAGEVAFAVVGAVATGLMGLTADASKSIVETFPRLSKPLEWVKLSHVPVVHNEITVEHHGIGQTTFSNNAGPALQWRATFPVLEAGKSSRIVVDGVPAAAQLERRANQQPAISALVPVRAGQSRTAKYIA